MNRSITTLRAGTAARLLTMFSLTALLMLVATTGRAAPPPSFADLAEKLGPSVVNIYTTQTVQAPSSPHHFFFEGEELPELFRRFFDSPSPHSRPPRGTPPREMQRTSLGSGVIISPDGYIVTNNHVVENADSINIRLTNFEEYDAEVVGRDPKTDLALLKIEAKSALPAVKMGDSDALRVGDWVIAIGNPFGFEQTVTAGIVSGKGRSLGSGPYENFIQTDASINPGNSGGPLFNLQGEMVGINTAIYSRGGGNIGIGFAIPVNMAKNIIDQIREHGTVTRGWLGVLIQHVTPELARQFQLDRPIGALVGEVSPESPAAEAGMRPGDVIVEYDGKKITQMSMVPTLVSQTPVGQEVLVKVIRRGQEQDLLVTIGKLDEDDQLPVPRTQEAEEKLGLGAQELTEEVARSLGLKDPIGVLISHVEPGSPAQRAGLRRGEVIVEVNQQPVGNLAEYGEMMEQALEKGEVLLLVNRGGQHRYVAISIR
ncbi:DegQ family serine endoprotease [Desulfurivibrio dismutans]|uniref:DegQ family serine endoprotease n=1 Tax=Desulfurivibrio dismutans TaxID=1398908 RepID=UPI0023D98E1C|nr:DegQ family serine endoprotease [Desulfurivibrio alkaliphilus]MDF1613415.1 DegQ family serine endoprotease [Desulfurivibrio alkaliphilus]